MAKPEPNIAEWLHEAKNCAEAANIGMYLTHNGVVRATPKHVVRDEAKAPDGAGDKVVAVDFSYDEAGLHAAVEEARTWEGIHYVRVWLNEGIIPVGGSLMYVLIGSDIRPHAVDALQRLVGHIKNDLVVEREVYR